MIKRGILLLLFIFIFFITISCTKNNETSSDVIDAIEDLSLVLRVNDIYNLNISDDIIIDPHDKNIVFVNSKKKEIKGLSKGTTKATIYKKDNLKISKVINITVTEGLNLEIDETGEIEIHNPIDTLYLDDEYKLDITSKNNLDLKYESSNPEIATINKDGNIEIFDSGIFSIRIYPENKPEIYSTIEIEVKPYINPERFIEKVAISEPTIKNITVTGYQFSYEYMLMGSLSNYLFDNLEIIEKYIPKGNQNRPGTTVNGNKFKALYVTMHDTGATDKTANALRHAKYWSNKGVTTSAHFATGNDGIYQLLPYNEIGYHAGDGTTESLKFTDTKIKATSNLPATVTISKDGYFVLNGIESNILAPKKSNGSLCTNKDLPTTGINNYVDSNTGTYWIGSTYYNTTYNTLSNHGGNLNSIGIESSVNQGSNIYLTWAMTAKLIGAEILPKNNLQPKDIKQHNTFSGKNCPQTMREANEWENFIKMCEVEYLFAKYFSDWNITFECNSPYIDKNGLIIKLPNSNTFIKYKIRMSNNTDYNKSFEFTAKIKVK